MNTSTTPRWQAKVDAAAQEVVDTEGACEIVGKITGQKPSKNTLRRWSIPYRLPGRKRIYTVDVVVDHARRRLDEAPVRVAPDARRRPRPTRPAPKSLGSITP